MSDEKLDLIKEARRQWLAHGYTGVDQSMTAVISLMRMNQIFLARLEETVRPHGLSYAGYKLLMLLYFTRQGELPLNKIGDRLGVHPASVTGVVDKLEQQGLVTRVPHPQDRRGVLARITEKGRELAVTATEDVNAGPFGDIFLPKTDVDQLIRLLTKMRRNAGDF